MISKNKPIPKITLGGLPTQNSRIFPGSYEKKSRFFEESQALKENPKIQGFKCFTKFNLRRTRG